VSTLRVKYSVISKVANNKSEERGGDLKQNLIIHGHNTRRKLDLHIYFCNTVLFQRSVINMGIKLFNNLPDNKKNLITSNFQKKKKKKKELKSLLLVNSFYTIDEFLKFE
jgi:hypothetical protein